MRQSKKIQSLVFMILTGVFVISMIVLTEKTTVSASEENLEKAEPDFSEEEILMIPDTETPDSDVEYFYYPESINPNKETEEKDNFGEEQTTENEDIFEDGSSSPSESSLILSEIEDIFQDAVSLYAGKNSIDAVYRATGKNLAESAKLYIPQVSSINGEWQILGLSRSDQAVDSSVYTGYKSNVLRILKEKNGILHSKKYSEYSRVVLALTALGEDVTNIGGYNLLKPLSDFDQTVWQGINGAIFALLAFDSHNYKIPDAETGKTQTTREKLIEHILSLELSGGGWALSGNRADPDITAMCMQSLARYYSSDSAVKNAVDRGINCLSTLQGGDGGYESWGQTNSESCSQVVVALTALGIDPNTDKRFTKNGFSVMDALLTYATSDGSFLHTPGGSPDQMATEQAYYALTAYQRLKEGKTFLYDMSDVILKSGTGSTQDGTGDEDNGQTAFPENSESENSGNNNYAGNSGESVTNSQFSTDKTASGSTKKVNLTSGGTTGASSVAASGTASGNASRSDGEIPDAENAADEEGSEEKDQDETDKAAEDLILQIREFLQTSLSEGVLPKNSNHYTKTQVNQIIQIYRQFLLLSKFQQQEVKKTSSYKEYESVLKTLKERNHYDRESGIDLRDNEEEQLPWYIQLEVNPVMMSEELKKSVKEAMNHKGEIFSLLDIQLTNLLDQTEWEPKDIIRVGIPLTDIGSYKNAALIHIDDNGKMVFLEGSEFGDYLEFDTDGFSEYGIVGFNGTLETLMEEKKEAFQWFYLIPGLSAGFILFFIVFFKKTIGKE